MRSLQERPPIVMWFATAFSATLLFTSPVFAQEMSLIPAPVSLKKGNGSFTLSNSTTIIIPGKNPEVYKVGNYLSNELKGATGFSLKTTENGDRGIHLILNTTTDPEIGKEGYKLVASEANIEVRANQPAGLFYGSQTLMQLLPPEIESESKVNNVSWNIPAVTISDYPRFGWRGIMLDVSRHFFPKEYIQAYIDQLARYKFNRFHWHLTDDNGWRIEIKSLPKLTQVGAWRVPRTGTFGSHDAPRPGEAATDGGFYTQEDIKEIVQYARDRFIEILPEVDVPGHSMAAIAAYPELSVTRDTTTKVNPGSNFSTWYGNGKFEMHIDNTLNPTDEKVYQFLDKVFTEIAMLFPFEYIHMGGDECYKGFWERDAGVQAFMKKNKIENGEGLQAFFNNRVNKIISAKNKKLIGWDEILEGGISAGAAVMSWRGSKGGIEATRLKHTVVMSPAPAYYLDMMQGDPSVELPIYGTARLKDVYAFNILPPGIDSTYVLGGQGNLWTEHVTTSPQVEYMTYPRALAISESMWSPRSKKDWTNFVDRVENHFKRFDNAGINYAQGMYDPVITVKKNNKGELTIDLSTEMSGLDIFYTLDNSIPNQYYTKYNGAFVLPQGTDQLRLISYRDGKPMGRLISLRTEDLEKRAAKK